MTTTNRFVGYLVSVECKNIFYQGIVTNIDPSKAVIQLKNCFQNGIHLGSKLIDIKTTEIENIEILADPQNAVTLLKPKSNENNSISSNDSINNNNNNNSSHSLPISSNTKNNSSNSNINRLLQNLESSAKQQHQTKIQSSESNTNKPKSLSSSSSNSTSTNNKLSLSSSSANNFNNISNNNNNNKKDLDLSPNSYNNSNNHKKFNGNGNGNGFHNYDSSNESCFNSITADTLKDDFDFEKNLALFDKDAFYEEMEGQPRPAKSNNSEDESSSIFKKLVNGSLNNPNNNNNNNNTNNSHNSSFTQSSTHKYHQISVANLFSSSSMSLPPSLHSETTSSNSNHIKTHGTNGSNNKNYRYDEMVLDTGEPIDMHQIKIGSISPSSYSKTYVTDDGFVVPCIEPELRDKLFEQSYKLGLTKERQIECMGRCCTEMALQLVGGPIRFSPKNNHQKPSILVLVTNESLQSSYALCTARLLSIRSVRVYLFIHENFVNNNQINQLFQNELNLLLSNKDNDSLIKKIEQVDDIKNLNSIDLIINGLSDMKYEKQQWYRQLNRHVSNLKASVLTVDPSKEYGTGQIKSKWSIVPVMPMDMNEQACGRIYLCDLGFTKNVFQSVNIKYKSPFGAKFLIPLHND
jgi:hypothetical protein